MATTMAALATLAIGGCSSSPQDETASAGNSPYAQEIEELRSRTDSDFIRRVLADGEISAAEMAESEAGTLACIDREDLNMRFVTHPDGSRGLRWTDSGPLDDDAMHACSRAWDDGLGSIYESIRVNPNNEDFAELVAACLVRTGLAPDGFTSEDLEALMKSGSRGMEVTFDHDGNVIDDRVDREVADEHPLLPGGVPLWGPETAACQSNPLAEGL
jgi:hypothetical protein